MCIAELRNGQIYIYMHNNIIATSNFTLSLGKENLPKNLLTSYISFNPQITFLDRTVENRNTEKSFLFYRLALY